MSPAAEVKATDTTAPEKPSDVLLSTDGLTVTGKAEANATITVKDAEGNTLASDKASSDGSFTVTLTAAQTNGQSLSVTATDGANNVSPAAEVKATDTTAPEKPSDVLLSTDGLTVTGKAEANATITVKDAEGNTLASDKASSDGSFTVTLTAAQTNGQSLTVTATDAAGNTSQPATITAPTVEPLVANDDMHTAIIGGTADNLNSVSGNISQAAELGILGNIINIKALTSNSVTINVEEGSTEDVTLKVAGSISLSAFGIASNLLSKLGGSQITADLSIIDKATGQVIKVISDAITLQPGGLGLSYQGTASARDLPPGQYTAVISSPSTTDPFGQFLQNVGSLDLGSNISVDVIDSFEYKGETTSGNVLSGDTTPGAKEIGDVADSGDNLTVTGISLDNGKGDITTVASEGTSIKGSYGTLTIHNDGSYTYQADSDIKNAGKSDIFTYTVKDAYGDTATAKLTINLDGKHSEARADSVTLDDTTTSLAQTAVTQTEQALNQTVSSTSKQTTTGTDTEHFSVAEGSLLRDATLSAYIDVKTADTNVNLSIKIYHAVKNSDGSYGKYGEAIWTSEPFDGDIKVTSLLNPVHNLPLSLSNIDLTSGDYVIESSYALTTTKLLLDRTSTVTFSGTLSGTSVDTTSHVTGSNVVKGNILDGSDSADVADSIGTLYKSLTISGMNAFNQKVSYTVNTPLNNVTDQNGNTISSDSVQLYGKYGVLTFNSDGSYSYTLTQGIDTSKITSKEIFDYSLTDKDGVHSDSQLTIDLHLTINGSDNNDIISSTAYDDTFNTGSGADTIIYHVFADDNTGGNGSDTWVDYNPSLGDKLDISELLVGYSGDKSTLSDFVKITYEDGKNIITVDRDGNGNQYQAATLMTIDGPQYTLDQVLKTVTASTVQANSPNLLVTDDNNTVQIVKGTSIVTGYNGSVAQLNQTTQLGDTLEASQYQKSGFNFSVNQDTTQDVTIQITGTQAKLLSSSISANLTIIDSSTGKVVEVVKDGVTLVVTVTNSSYTGTVALHHLLPGNYTALVTKSDADLGGIGLSPNITATITDSVQYITADVQGNVLNNDRVVDDSSATLQVTEVTVNGTTGLSTYTISATGTEIQGNYGTLTLYSDGSYRYHSNGDIQDAGKSDTFTYRVADSAGEQSTATLTLTTAGTHSEVVSDTHEITETTYSTSTENAQLLNEASMGETTSITSGSHVTSSAQTGSFTIAKGTELQNASFTLETKTKAGSLKSSLDSKGTLTLYRHDENGDVIVYKDENWSAGQNSLLGLTATTSYTSTLTGVDLTSGDYYAKLNYSGDISGKIDLTFNGSLSGTLVNTDTHLTTGETVTGNILTGDEAGAGADTLGSLFNSLTVTGKDSTGKDVTYTFNKPLNDITDSDGNKVSGSSVELYGHYGLLTLNTDGSYSYTLNKGIDTSDITSRENFSYSLTDQDGKQSAGELNIDLKLNINGSSNSESVASTAYDDHFTLGTGSDTVVYKLLADDNTGGNGNDTWTGFSAGQGDHIDVSALLVGWDGESSSLGNYISVSHTDNSTVVSIDRDGTGSHYSSATLITLDAPNVTLDELIEHNTTSS
ncbi:Ig-like domain-containing protein [Rosenbergiella epipactidis]|uniref:BapA/Bap/LapF family large adhesin n=1 Tax=Rosenbergiella epipactidis TaxID=1544694 RepID=UPI002025FFD6|nr:Ig-like domain-containing protein [Rosenbergiella epipactidis]